MYTHKTVLSNIGKISTLLVLAAFATGCATRSMYEEANNNFAKGLEAGGATIGSILSTATRDARLRSIGYYLEKGPEPDNLDNRTSDKVKESFPRYVCAGVGKYLEEQISLNTLSAYKTHIAGLTNSPSEDLSSLIKSIRNLDEGQPSLKIPIRSNLKYFEADCRINVSALLKNYGPGQPIPTPPEKPADDKLEVFKVGSIDKIDTLIASLKASLVGVLKIVDDAKRVKALKNYVIKNENVMRALLLELTSTMNIKNALKERKAAALVKPYYLFTEMLKGYNYMTQRQEILKFETEINSSLSEYDHIGLVPNPEVLMKDVSEAHAKLVKLAKGELSLGEAWASFKVFLDSAEAARAAIVSR